MQRTLLGLTVATVLFGASVAVSAEFNFVHASLNPKNHIDYPVNMDFVERVKRLSQGRMDFRVFDSGSLGDENEMVEQIRSGTITTARLSPAPLSSICSSYSIVNLPFLFSGPEHLLKTLQSEGFAELCDSALIDAGIRPLGYWWLGTRDLYTKRPVRTLDDLKGMKLRVWEDKYVVESWKALQAIPTPISMSELYTALQTGIIDGAEGWVATYNARSFQQVAPNVTRVGYINIASTVVISEKIWSTLPEALRAVIRQAAQENAAFALETFKREDAKIYERAVKQGATVLDVSDIERWRQAAAPVADKFAAEYGTKSAALIEWIKKNR